MRELKIGDCIFYALKEFLRTEPGHIDEIRTATEETYELLNKLARAEATIARLREALEGLRIGGCFCGVAIGSPMLTSHTKACNVTTALLAETADPPKGIGPFKILPDSDEHILREYLKTARNYYELGDNIDAIVDEGDAAFAALDRIIESARAKSEDPRRTWEEMDSAIYDEWHKAGDIGLKDAIHAALLKLGMLRE